MAAKDEDILPALEALADCDFVVIDCPPRLEKTIRHILMASDLVIAPIGALAMEIWAASDIAELMNKAQDAKPDLDARILWNKYRNTTDEQLMLADGKKSLGLKSMKAILGYRAAYTDAAGWGLTVLEWSNQKAKEEVTALVKEITNILKRR